MTTPAQATVKTTGMPREMELYAIQTAVDMMDRFSSEKDVASNIKKEFDHKYGKAWHVFVGRNFGSFVTHETHHYIYFYLGQMAFLIFKCGNG